MKGKKSFPKFISKNVLVQMFSSVCRAITLLDGYRSRKYSTGYWTVKKECAFQDKNGFESFKFFSPSVN